MALDMIQGINLDSVRPRIHLMGSLRGNEAVGRELLLHLIAYLVCNYDSDPVVRDILESTEL